MRTHYCGNGINGMSPGWPVCGSGDFAFKVATDGNQTYKLNYVTCKKCLNKMHKNGLIRKPIIVSKIMNLKTIIKVEEETELFLSNIIFMKKYYTSDAPKNLPLPQAQQLIKTQSLKLNKLLVKLIAPS